MTRTCKYEPCSKEFEPTDSRHFYCGPTCRANQHYAANPEKGRSVHSDPLQSVANHPLQEVRDERATKKHNRDLGGLIKQAIVDRIKTTGECHADDLVDLYPEGEVDLCRRLATAQFGSMAARELIRKDGWRRTANSSRKGGGGWIWKFTEKGRAALVGHRAGGRDQTEKMEPRPVNATPSSVPGENGAGVSESVRPEEVTSVDLESASTPLPESSPGTISMLPEPDPKAWAA